MCVFALQIRSGKFLVLRRIPRDFVVNVHKWPCKAPVIPFRF